MQNFTPISKVSVSQSIIDQILQMIENGTLKPGDKIPPERELCELLKVGRSSVRESLKVLEVMGLIAHEGKNTVLCEREDMNPATVLSLSSAFSDINEVFETRKLLEIEIVELAVKRANEDDLSMIAATIQDTFDPADFNASDEAFHRAITHATHNQVLCQVYTLVSDLLFRTHNYYARLKVIEPELHDRIIRESIQFHRSILSAIAAKDVKRARSAVKNHLSAAEDYLLKSVNIRRKTLEIDP